jgi:Fur family ferric uptake transcriptional regulator
MLDVRRPMSGCYRAGMGHEDERDALARYLEDHNLKRTRQRDIILDAFLTAKGHVSSEDLYQTIRKKNPRIGYTTVYRTMKLFVEAGLAEERHFDDGVARYEIEQEHHDHLVCTKCGRIVEFESDLIEKTQTDIAAKYGFRILRHRHELYGHCSNCRDD